MFVQVIIYTKDDVFCLLFYSSFKLFIYKLELLFVLYINVACSNNFYPQKALCPCWKNHAIGSYFIGSNLL